MKAHIKTAFLLIFLLFSVSCSTGEGIVLRMSETEESEYFSREEAAPAESTMEEEPEEVPTLSEPEEIEEFSSEEEEIFAEISVENSPEIITQEQTSYDSSCASIESDENYIYLLSILESKTFEAPMKDEIIDTYEKVSQNYDGVYAYEKIPKEKYLKMFCDVIKDNLEVAELVEEQDAGEPYAELLESKGAIGLTKNDAIYLAVDTIDRVEANLLHEIWHLENQWLKVLIGDNGIDIGVGTREGLSVWQEGFVELLADEEVITCDVGMSRKIKMNKDIIQRGDSEEYTAVYPGYKNNTERLITLIGMKTYMDIVHSDHDYIASLRAELNKEFDKDKVDEFLINYVISTCFISKNGIKVMDRIDDRCDSIRHNISENEELLSSSTQEEFYSKWEQKIKTEEGQINRYQAIIDDYTAEDTLNEYMKSTIATLESLIYMLTNNIAIRKDLAENYTYEALVDLIKFDTEADKAKLEVFENYLENEYEIVWDVIIALENSFNNLMVERINNAQNPEEFNEAKASCVYYDQEVRIICLENNQDVTRSNFENTVIMALNSRSDSEFDAP